MKFLVDQPLGGLAKWLRFCGFDATLMRLAPDKPGSLAAPPAPDPYPDPAGGLPASQAAGSLVLAAPEPEGQLTEVIRRLHLTPRHLKPLTRCRHCNDPLAPLSREQAQSRVSEYVFQHHRRFYECPRCHRVYWPGSHLQGITAALRDQLEHQGQPGPHPPE